MRAQSLNSVIFPNKALYFAEAKQRLLQGTTAEMFVSDLRLQGWLRYDVTVLIVDDFRYVENWRPYAHTVSSIGSHVCHTPMHRYWGG